jgi:hypothetical protein
MNYTKHGEQIPEYNTISKINEFWVIYKHLTQGPNYQMISYLIPRLQIVAVAPRGSAYQSSVTFSMSVRCVNNQVDLLIGSSVRLNWGYGYIYLTDDMNKDKIIDILNSRSLIVPPNESKIVKKYITDKIDKQTFINFLKLKDFKQPL